MNHQHLDTHALRAAAATSRLATRTFAAEVDHSFLHSLICLCEAPTLTARGLAPLDTELMAMPVEQTLTVLATEYCRLFIGPQPICPPYASARTTRTALGINAIQAVQGFLHQHSLQPQLPQGAPIAADDHAAVAFALLERLYLTAADTADAGYTPDSTLAAIATLRTGYIDLWLPAFLADVAAASTLGPYRPVAVLADMVLRDNNLGITTLAPPTITEEQMITIYSTSTCGFCHRLKTQLEREHIPFTDINIELDPQAASYVESVNGGNQVVPTVVCANGTVMTNPSLAEVKQCLTPAGAH